MFLLGGTLGGMVIVYLISKLLGWAIIDRALEEGEASIITAIVLAVCVCCAIYAYATGGLFPGGYAYLLAGIILCPIRLRSYRRRLDAPLDDSELRNTFE